ncbi:unnamed protein product [Leptosia nina]|uniref:FP protein C-terminal domain-containing protein n=1 Tax=Leptosia nina TaxID=320188 RepID=A0AAV1JUR5_9NEOP
MAAGAQISDAETTLIENSAIVSLTTERQHYDSEPNLHLLSTNVTERKKRKFDGDDSENFMVTIKYMFDAFSKEQNKRFQDLLVSVNCIREQNSELTKSVETMSSKYDEFLSRIKHLEDARKEDKKYVSILEQRLETLERKSRASGIELRNIPKTITGKPETKSDLCQLTQLMGKAINIDIRESDVRDIYRINSKDSSNPIIAEFTSVLVKEKILSAVKSFNKKKQKGEKLNTGHFGTVGPIKPAFVTETLTQQTQKIFYLARTFQKEHGYDFCWTSRGVVYLRKNSNLSQIKIECQADLDKLKQLK